MGLSLQQAMNTASMGMKAAESSINVIGNNLSNANTVGFKANRADFADMFSRTYTYGSQPGSYNGGTNPLQIGLGVTLTGVSTDFTQGTIKPGMTGTDMAIQGDGFFVVQADPNNPYSQYYTRNGVIKRNSVGELVNSNGLYVMGYGVNDRFELQRDELQVLTIPLGEMKIAQATENVLLDGLLNATGKAAEQGTVLETGTLTDLSWSSPGASSLETSLVLKPSVETAGTEGTGLIGSGAVSEGDYYYRFVFVDPQGVESDYSAPIEVSVLPGENSIELTNLPQGEMPYTGLRIYRAEKPENPESPGVFYQVSTLDLANLPDSYVDNASTESITDPAKELDQNRLNGKYSYYVTYIDANGNESRPSYLSNTQFVNGGQILLSDIPTVDPANNPDQWTGRNIYRCDGNNPDSYYLLTTINSLDSSATFVDKTPDQSLILNQPLSLGGRGNVLMNGNTKLTDIGQHTEEGRFVPVFDLGTLSFKANKGGADMKSQTLFITEETTAGDYLNFLNECFGIRPANPGSNIPPDQGEIGKTINNGSPGATIRDGSFVVLGNSGTENSLYIGNSSMSLKKEDGMTSIVHLPYSGVQSANGESLGMTMTVYDSLGAPVTVKMTMVLQEKTDTETIYRWYADSSDNHPLLGNAIALGTGLVKFDSNGSYIDATNTTITVQRTQEASESPMSFTFDMDLSSIAALATTKSEMRMIAQDGAGAGILMDYNIDENGTIYGIFSSQVSRPIGQVALATFMNPEGLIKRGDNLFAVGPDSGLPRISDPGTGTAGIIKSNSVELSNTDISRELIDMILASTMYQANAKIISTSNVMMDALLRVAG
ncbi:MAG: flagellar hook-basal body complex protein [Thermoguttaceae bacterium]